MYGEGGTGVCDVWHLHQERSWGQDGTLPQIGVGRGGLRWAVGWRVMVAPIRYVQYAPCQVRYVSVPFPPSPCLPHARSAMSRPPCSWRGLVLATCCACSATLSSKIHGWCCWSLTPHTWPMHVTPLWACPPWGCAFMPWGPPCPKPVILTVSVTLTIILALPESPSEPSP